MEEKKFSGPEEVLRGVEELGNVIPFTSDEFNKDQLEQVFKANIDEFGNLVTSPEELEKDLREILSLGFGQALASGDVNAMARASQTVASALHELSQEGEFLSANPRAASEAAQLVIRSLEGVPAEPLGPIDLNVLVNESFGPELEFLAQRSPSLPDLQSVRRQFGQSLLETPKSLGQLNALETYINQHVANPVLKASLLGDLRDRIRRTRLLQDPSEARISKPVPLIQPLSATKALVIQRPLLSEFGIGIAQKVAEWESELRTQAPSRGLVIKDVRETIDKLNAVFRRIQFKSPGAKDVLQIRPGKRSAVKLVARLSSFAKNVLGDSSRTFTFIPAESEGRMQDSHQIIGLLREILSGPHATIHRTMIPHPIRVRKFGAITIRKEAGKDPSAREIVIPPEASLGDVMRLSQALVMEDGKLEDLSGEEVFQIKKGETDAGSVVSYFQAILDQAGGVIIRVRYLPASFGEFVDGFMADMMHGGALLKAHSKAKQQLMKRGIGDFSKFGGALPAVALGAAALAAPVAGVADIIGKAVPPLKIITEPIKAVANVIKGIGKIFGF